MVTIKIFGWYNGCYHLEARNEKLRLTATIISCSDRTTRSMDHMQDSYSIKYYSYNPVTVKSIKSKRVAFSFLTRSLIHLFFYCFLWFLKAAYLSLTTDNFPLPLYKPHYIQNISHLSMHSWHQAAML